MHVNIHHSTPAIEKVLNECLFFLCFFYFHHNSPIHIQVPVWIVPSMTNSLSGLIFAYQLRYAASRENYWEGTELQDYGRCLDGEEQGLEESQVPRSSARDGTGKQKLMGISLLKSPPFGQA